MKLEIDYIKCPIHHLTFRVKPIKEWVENESNGLVLNLFAGETRLNLNEIRNDIREDMDAEYHKEAVDFCEEWDGEKFNTIILDPPYAYRKSMEYYNGAKASKFKIVKDIIPNILEKGGKIITFGYHSNVMGKNRGFYLDKIALFSHGGAIHDTIASVEIKK